MTFLPPEGLSDLRDVFPEMRPVRPIVSPTIVLRLTGFRAPAALVASSHGWTVLTLEPWWKTALNIGRACL